VNERHEKYAAVRQAIADADPDLRRVIDVSIEYLATELGESPEAWRGAEVVADMMVQALSVGLKEPGAEAHLLQAAVSLMIELSMHPLTPWGRGVDR
jgi:hypothetical protein